jgi:hypothetical protein
MSTRFTNMEQDAISALTSRLQRRFAEVPPKQVTDMVEHFYHDFDDSRIRQFVPLLVEHAARDELYKIGSVSWE